MLLTLPSSRMIFLAVVLLVPSVFGQADARVRWATPGSYHLQFSDVGAFELDNEGTRSDRQAFGRHRLRLKPTIQIGVFSGHIELDVLTGQVFGTTTDVGADFASRREMNPDEAYDGWTTVEPRQAWFALRMPAATLKAGTYADHWGLGLKQHDGRQASIASGWVLRPMRSWHGDLMTGAQLAIRPAAPFSFGGLRGLTVLMGGGIVYQDDYGSIFEEDEAEKYHVAFEFPGEQLQAGAGYFYRTQTGRGDARLDIGTVDTFIRWTTPLFLRNAEIRFEAQYVANYGERVQPTSFGAPPENKLENWGAVASVEYRSLCPRVAMGVDLGYLSGDRADTKVDESFTADPDFGLGFILFPEVVRMQSVRSAERLRILEQDQSTFLGANELPTKGAARNVAYFAPGVTWRPGAAVLGLYGLVAWAPEPVQDPVNTAQASGELTNALGRAPLDITVWKPRFYFDIS